MNEPDLCLNNYDRIIHPMKQFEYSFDISEQAMCQGYTSSDVSTPAFKLYAIRMYLEYQKYEPLKTLITEFPLGDTDYPLCDDFFEPNIEWFQSYGYKIFSSIYMFGWNLSNNVCFSYYNIDDEIKPEDTRFKLQNLNPVLYGFESYLTNINELLDFYDYVDFFHLSLSIICNPMLGSYYQAINNGLSVDSNTKQLIDKLVNEFESMYSGGELSSESHQSDNLFKIAFLEGYMDEVNYYDVSYSYLSIPIAAYWLHKILTELNEVHHFFRKENYDTI